MTNLCFRPERQPTGSKGFVMLLMLLMLLTEHCPNGCVCAPRWPRPTLQCGVAATTSENKCMHAYLPSFCSLGRHHPVSLCPPPSLSSLLLPCLTCCPHKGPCFRHFAPP
ncbi:hypothetical protein EV126DRAFT_411379 [Verticillium dahliae]|nr:hypothetical protein EV126DRAFT_411379 [Verticillium dahliae]